MAVFSSIGRAFFAEALANGLRNETFDAFFRVVGGSIVGPFPIDRVVANDTDPANYGKGEAVISFRVVIPAGTDIPGPCDTAEVRCKGSVVFKQPLNAFRASASHASVLFLNFILGEK